MTVLKAKCLCVTLNEELGLISSIKINGDERCNAPSHIFKIKLRHLNGKAVYVNSAEAVSVIKENGSVIYRGFSLDFSNTEVKITVKADNDIKWFISVRNVPKEYAIEWIEYPRACLPRLIDNDPNGGRIIFPYDEGILLTDEASLPRYEPEFPMSGAYFIFPNKVCSQFIGYLFENDGLYIGAHDKKRGFKGIDFYPQGEGISLHIRLYSGVGYGMDYCCDFPIVWQVCGPHWKNPTDIYRAWLEKNLPDNIIPIRENSSLPKWYRDNPVIVTYPVRGIHDMDKMEPNALFPYTSALPHLNKIKSATGCHIMSLLMHWEGTAPWAPPYVWPPYGGVDCFNEFRDELHKSGDLLGVYCSGLGYTLQSTLIDSYNCEEKIRNENVLDSVCHSPENKPEQGITCTPYQRYGYDICPASERGRQILREGFEPVFRSGVDYAQILDQNHGGGQYMCFAREHKHPPMPGGWMTENMQELLAEWNASAPNMLFGCESAASEPFIGNLLMSDNRFELNYPYGTPTPVYAYLYHEYVRNFMGNQCGCPFEPSCDTLRYRLAYSFSIGDIMTLVLAPSGELMTHWGTHDFEHAPNMEKTLRFIRNVMSFYRRDGEKYLYSGKMVFAPDIECEKITLPLFRVCKETSLPRLHFSTWDAGDKKVAYIVVNPEDVAVSFKIGDTSYKAKPLDATLIIK